MQQEPSTTPTKPKKAAEGTHNKRRRRRSGIFNLILFVGIIGAVGLFFWAEQQRRDALSKLEETQAQLEEIKESTERSGQQVADEVLNKLREHMEIATEPQPTVATIIDVDRLRETSDFYKNAENGDHLILTETRAILFDPNTNRIIDVVPVILNPEDQPTESDDPEKTGTKSQADNPAQPQDTTQETRAPGSNTNTNDGTGPDTQAVPDGGNVPTTQ